jgi:hypothetical protein
LNDSEKDEVFIMGSFFTGQGKEIRCDISEDTAPKLTGSHEVNHKKFHLEKRIQ